MKKNDIRKIFVAGLILSPYLYFGNLSNAQTYYNPYGVTYTGNSSSGVMNPYYPTINKEESSSALAEKLESLLSKYCIPKSCSTAALSFTNNKCYCGGGKYYKPSSRSCGTCIKGTYSNGYEYDSCPYCPVGKYSNVSGASSCTSCSAGTYQNQTGQSSCKTCNAGTYQNLTGASSCTNCSAGTYQNLTGQSSCKSCSAGTYQDKTGQTSCKTCGTGFYSGTGASNCTRCKSKEAGPWSASCGSASRTVTRYCTSIGSTSPTSNPVTKTETDTLSCAAGQGCYSGSCRTCSAGMYSAGSSGACSTCPAGQYSGTGASSCTSCPTGQYSSAGASGCNYCTNAPANAHYTSNATSNSCSWECNSGYALKNGVCKKRYIICLVDVTVRSESRSKTTTYTIKCSYRYSGDILKSDTYYLHPQSTDNYMPKLPYFYTSTNKCDTITNNNTTYMGYSYESELNCSYKEICAQGGCQIKEDSCNNVRYDNLTTTNVPVILENKECKSVCSSGYGEVNGSMVSGGGCYALYKLDMRIQ